MPRRFFSTKTAEEVRGLLAVAESTLAVGGTYISGGAADVSWGKTAELPAARLVIMLQRELSLLGDPSYPADDYIGNDVTLVRFS